MALNTEIWIRTIIEQFWPDNSFISRSVDHSSYVNNHSVHIPQAGNSPSITKNRTSFPATIKTRTDGELTYDLDIYDVEPLRTHKLSEVELRSSRPRAMPRLPTCTPPPRATARR